MQGMHVRIASPEGYELPAAIQQRVASQGRDGAMLTLLSDPVAAVRGAAAVYTDVWTSMGQENETAIRTRAFTGFQVNESLMAHASPDAIFMHCLPAHRGEEVSAGVMDGPSSVVFDQAENRLHAQKALLAMLFE
jgi:ornithine carbamoyltransferase